MQIFLHALQINRMFFSHYKKSGIIIHIHAIGSIDFHIRGDDSSGHLCEMQLFYKFEFTVDKPRIALQKWRETKLQASINTAVAEVLSISATAFRAPPRYFLIIDWHDPIYHFYVEMLS